MAKTTPVAFDADSARLAELPWRSIGPAVTSGRVVDFAVPEGPKSQIGERLGELFYVASASGGVWKTANGGTTWEPIFDHQGAASIGDIAVAPSNPDILWVGTGENNNQRSSSWGDGVYKSENAGKTSGHSSSASTRTVPPRTSALQRRRPARPASGTSTSPATATVPARATNPGAR